METIELIFKSIVFFSLLMFIVVGFHEKGHYLAARMLGVKVLKFSIGMGKEVWGWTGKTGIRYSLSALPLGGYVKMLDTTEMEEEELKGYTKEDIASSFDNAPVWKRFIIVAMGPFFNLIMAFIAFTIISYGVLYIPSSQVDYVADTIVYNVESETRIEKGDVITAIDGVKVEYWSDVHNQMMGALGKESVMVTLADKGIANLNMSGKEINSLTVSINYLVGLLPQSQNYPAVIGAIGEDSPASKSELMVGDVITQVNGKPVLNFFELSEALAPLNNKSASITFMRNGTLDQTEVNIGEFGNPIDGRAGFLGVMPKAHAVDKTQFVIKNVGLMEAMSISTERSYDASMLIVNTLKKLVTGSVSPTSLSGAIGIADASQKAASFGVMSFIGFIGFFSINLMVLNLLPIKPLDGGHLFSYMIETIIRREVPVFVDTAVTYVGLAFIGLLMVMGLGADLLRIIY